MCNDSFNGTVQSDVISHVREEIESMRGRGGGRSRADGTERKSKRCCWSEHSRRSRASQQKSRVPPEAPFEQQKDVLLCVT